MIDKEVAKVKAEAEFQINEVTKKSNKQIEALRAQLVEVREKVN